MASLEWVPMASLELVPLSSPSERRQPGRPRKRPVVEPTTVELTPTRAHCTLAREDLCERAPTTAETR